MRKLGIPFAMTTTGVALAAGCMVLAAATADAAIVSVVGGGAIIAAPGNICDDAPGATTGVTQEGFDEAQGVLLGAAGVLVDNGGASAALPGTAIAGDTLVDSHMIFLNTAVGAGGAANVNVVWTFSGAVLGVMSDNNGTLEAGSSAVLGNPATDYLPGAICTQVGNRGYAPFSARGLEGSGTGVGGEGYTIAGNTLTVGMAVSEPGDWIRVVTAHNGNGNGNGNGIGEIKPDSIFTPNPNGNGRAVAFDGLTTLYYTFTGNANIYQATTLGVSLGSIPLAGRNFTCGALSFDGTDLWCGTYDGTGNVQTVNPTTGVANFEFTHAFNGNGCFGVTGFINGLAFDRSDGTLWLSDDGDTEIFHVNQAGGVIGGPFPTPTRPGGVGNGCNSGIAVAPGGFLELMLLAFEPGNNGGAGDGVSHFIVKVPKDDISGTPIVSFPTQDPDTGEDLAFDARSFAPRAVVWANAFATNEIKAYDVQVTRTIGYWKNHPAEDFDGTSFLPIDLGDNDQNGVCDTAVDQADVEDILKAHKSQDTEAKLLAQLLAAELNLAMGDIPPGDLAAILPVIEDAHDLLGKNGCDPDTGKKGDDRAEAQALHALLDAFNNKYSP